MLLALTKSYEAGMVSGNSFHKVTEKRFFFSIFIYSQNVFKIIVNLQKIVRGIV